MPISGERFEGKSFTLCYFCFEFYYFHNKKEKRLLQIQTFQACSGYTLEVCETLGEERTMFKSLKN